MKRCVLFFFLGVIATITVGFTFSPIWEQLLQANKFGIASPKDEYSLRGDPYKSALAWDFLNSRNKFGIATPEDAIGGSRGLTISYDSPRYAWDSINTFNKIGIATPKDTISGGRYQSHCAWDYINPCNTFGIATPNDKEWHSIPQSQRYGIVINAGAGNDYSENVKEAMFRGFILGMAVQRNQQAISNRQQTNR